MEDHKIIANMIGKGVRLRDAMTAALGQHEAKSFPPAQMVDSKKKTI